MIKEKIKIDKAEIAVEFYKHESATKTIFLIHGRGGRKEQWQQQINYFKSTYNIVAFDLLGHGESSFIKPGELNNPYDLYHFVTSLKQLIDRYRSKENIIFAHSMGGAYAYALALEFYKELDITRLVLISPSPCQKFDVFMCKFWQQPLEILESYREELSTFFEVNGFHKNTSVKLIQEQVLAAKYNRLDVIAAMILGLTEVQVTELKFSIPVLLFTAKNDKLVLEAQSLSFYQQLPMLTHIQMESSGHFAQLEEPEKVNISINQWL